MYIYYICIYTYMINMSTFLMNIFIYRWNFREKKQFFRVVKLTLVLFDYCSLNINSENHNNAFHLITLNEKIDYVQNQWGTKEWKLKPQNSYYAEQRNLYYTSLYFNSKMDDMKKMWINLLQAIKSWKPQCGNRTQQKWAGYCFYKQLNFFGQAFDYRSKRTILCLKLLRKLLTN